jgi:glycosyltransferase involved in cell wall biosynthesis
MALAVIETHPIQYHAPVYRMLQQRFGVPVTAIYGSDFSVAGYEDREFGVKFAWDTDLLSGYSAVFLSRVAEGGARESSLVSARGIARALQATKPAAILLTGYSPRFHQLAFVQAWRSGRPILFRAETIDVGKRRHAAKALVRDLALRYLYRTCSQVLYTGQRSREHFERLGCSPDQLVPSPYCVDTVPFDPGEQARTRLRTETRSSLGIGTRQRVVLFSGKLVLGKGPDLLLRALKQRPVPSPDGIVVLFLGSGELQVALGTLANDDVPLNVRFLGFQNQTQLSRYYHAADLLVLPSYSETWGLVVNEALHHGLPCVVSEAVGCGPDLVLPGVTGEICQPGSAESLRAAIDRAFALVDRVEIRARCRATVGAYSLERAAEGIAAAYRAVVR